MNRNELLIRAAKARVILLSRIDSYITPTNSSAIVAGCKKQLAENGTTESAAKAMLAVMAKNNLITAIRKGMHISYAPKGYLLPKEVTAKADAKAPKGESKTLQIDYIQKTGRVRITINNIIMEIGVI